MVMTEDTTDPDYWLNWRFLLCFIWVITPMAVASYLIWRCEGPDRSKSECGETQQGTPPSVYFDESWKPCSKRMHPYWLLAFRIVAFFALLTVLLVDAIVDGFSVFYYYTQWTFALVTIYFGIGSVLSIYGCCFCNRVGGDGVGLDAERGAYVALLYDENSTSCNVAKSLDSHQQHYVRQTAGMWGYVFQILFQLIAGAVMLTDCVFWFIIFPFLTAHDRGLSFMKISTHSVNAVFLLGDTALNSLRFPWFRIAYFVLWTGIFVLFQWIVHVFVSLPWPYPILDLASNYAPVWYLVVGLMHLPCYGIFSLLIRIKEYLLSGSSSSSR